MNQREKVLVAAVTALVALWGSTQGWDKYQTALDSNLGTQRSVAQELSTVRAATERGRRAQQKLRQWNRQSLPTDPEIAKALYQDWLQQQLTDAGLQVKDIKISSPLASSNRYRQFTYVVSGSGKLGPFTDFLHRFYQAPHLHRISKSTLRPTGDDRQELTISLTIDALSLPEGDRKDQLAEGTNNEKISPLAEFQKEIVSRNLFATHQLPKPPVVVASNEEQPDNEAAQAKFSRIHYGEGGWLMAVSMEKTGKVMYFREGDMIRIGRFRGRIEQLDGDQRRAIVANRTGRLQIRLGQTLAEAQPYAESAS